ncbi:hypothetical protein A0H81_09769 [Grifola frondosa]|uniref:BTB domain-containing protein n=1 Tax=Grifola frondosa TaxID=5627 RepID=A0A1C7M1Q6_GRIFR|nr:hypothetical protein A0H81_09769 [Grifola frondosa]
MTSPFDFDDADVLLRADSPHADLSQNAPDADIFRVHRCILSTASPFFRTMFSLPQPVASCPDIPVIAVTESGATLEALLRFIYPVADPPIETLDQLSLVLNAARKYELDFVVEALRKLLVSPRYLRAWPLRVYAIATRHDLEEEARIASTATLAINILDCPLHEDLKSISAYSYHRLLQLHKQRAEAATKLLEIHDDVKCMLCNGTRYGTFTPPRWWPDFQQRARAELRLRPTTDVVFSMQFLAQSAVQAGCERCAGSILAAHWFFAQLKDQIDSLPATI